MSFYLRRATQIDNSSNHSTIRNICAYFGLGFYSAFHANVLPLRLVGSERALRHINYYHDSVEISK